MDIQQWIDGINEQTTRTEVILSDINEEQLNSSPAPGKWSIGELIDHISTANKTYFGTLEQLAEGTYANPSMLSVKFIPKAVGRMVINSITPETYRKVKTAPIFMPASTNHTFEVLDDFKSTQSRLIKLVSKIEGYDLSKTWIRSPVTGFIIYTAEAAINMLLNHEKRHLGQAEEILSNF